MVNKFSALLSCRMVGRGVGFRFRLWAGGCFVSLIFSFFVAAGLPAGFLLGVAGA